VENLIRHGWRFMLLKPKEVLEMTHREFTLVSMENVNRTHDENERLAMHSIMSSAASRGIGKKGKLPEISDLYKRPTDEEITKEDDKDMSEDIREMQEHTRDWLSQFDIDALYKSDKGKEETENGTT